MQRLTSVRYLFSYNLSEFQGSRRQANAHKGTFQLLCCLLFACAVANVGCWYNDYNSAAAAITAAAAAAAALAAVSATATLLLL
jgi:hypothetical protein